MVPLLAAIAGDRGGGWVYKLADWMMVTLLGAVAGCHCWAAIAGCHCWG